MTLPEPGSARKGFAITGLAVAFGWPLLFAIPGLSAHKLSDSRDDVVNISVKWAVLLGLGILAFLVQRWKPSDLGIRRLGLADVLAALGGLILAFVLSGIASHIVVMPTSLSDVRKLAAVPLGLRIGLVLTAAICEEFIYRGYAIEELGYLTGSRRLAGFLSWLVFAISHVSLYGVSRALVVPAIVGAVLTGLYLWRRSLPACMLMHALMNGIFLILVPAIAQG